MVLQASQISAELLPVCTLARSMRLPKATDEEVPASAKDMVVMGTPHEKRTLRSCNRDAVPRSLLPWSVPGFFPTVAPRRRASRISAVPNPPGPNPHPRSVFGKRGRFAAVSPYAPDPRRPRPCARSIQTGPPPCATASRRVGELPDGASSWQPSLFCELWGLPLFGSKKKQMGGLHISNTLVL